jgi:diguanylate cyclase (GGDEF)-like protein
VLAKELARCQRHLHPFSILMIDIDHFKRFNDTRGHQAGDEMLRLVADVIRSFLRASDVAARYGGEEFLIMLTETEQDGALRVAEKLRGGVEELRLQDKKAVTISIGVASFPDNGDDVESLVREADVALYKCKRSGRNRVALASAARQRGGASRAS